MKKDKVKVFKCSLDTYQQEGVHHIDCYAAKCFKGTEKQFNDHIQEFFYGKNVKPHTIYTDKTQVDNVDSEICGFNDARDFTGIDRNNQRFFNTEVSKTKAAKTYLRSGH